MSDEVFIALWKIAQTVATTPDVIAAIGDNDDKYCVFCSGDEDYTGKTEYLHSPDCIVLLARTLITQGKGGI